MDVGARSEHKRLRVGMGGAGGEHPRVMGAGGVSMSARQECMREQGGGAGCARGDAEVQARSTRAGRDCGRDVNARGSSECGMCTREARE